MASAHLGLIFELKYDKVPFLDLFVFICVNYLPDSLKSECKLFGDDASLFSAVHDLNTSATDINKDLKDKRLGFSVENEF